MKMTRPVFSRFLSLGCLISRLPCGTVSSPLMARTEWPNRTNIKTKVTWAKNVLCNQPRDSLVMGMAAAELKGLGGSWTGERRIVIVHQTMRITTMTVVMII